MYTAGPLIRKNSLERIMIKIVEAAVRVFIFLLKVLVKYEQSSVGCFRNKPTRHTRSTWHSCLSGWPHLITNWKEEKH